MKFFSSLKFFKHYFSFKINIYKKLRVIAKIFKIYEYFLDKIF